MTSVAWSIAIDHPAFAGHFPSRPIVPGVVLLDECLRAIDGAMAARAPLRIGSAKFLSIVGPGEALRLDFEDGSGDASFRLKLYAGEVGAERLAMSATVTMAGGAR